MAKACFALAAVLILCPRGASAQPTCTQIPGDSWTMAGTTAKLRGDCVTDTTILVPNNKTINGNGFTITAVDPEAGHFLGAVVRNDYDATVVDVTNLIIDTANLANVCDAGNDRLRGILFDNVSGRITNNTVLHINQGPSGCQEGNAIEVRNFFDEHPGPHLIRDVTVSGNRVYAWQKGGIVLNGALNGTVSNNIVGASATQANLAANGIQLGWGAHAHVIGNQIEGNTWKGYHPETSPWAATAVLLYDAGPESTVSNNFINLIEGNADVGIWAYANRVKVNGNRVYDFGPDVDGPDMDFGIVNDGHGNTFAKNRVRCFQSPFYDVTGSTNVELPCTDPTSTAPPMELMFSTMSAAAPARPAVSPVER